MFDFPSLSPSKRTFTDEAFVFIHRFVSFTNTHTRLSLQSSLPSQQPHPRHPRNPKLPLNETNAALAHFDRMQFSLFYSFPFSPFLHLPIPLLITAMEL